MSKEINEIINNLCEKLGTSAQLLIPELAKLKTTGALYMTIICFILTCVSVWLVVKSIKAAKEDAKEDYDYEVLPWVCTVGLLICVAGFIKFSWELAEWLASPTGKAVLEIMEMLR